MMSILSPSAPKCMKFSCELLVTQLDAEDDYEIAA